MNNLKPCPFCGGKAEIIQTGSMWSVNCQNAYVGSDCPVAPWTGYAQTKESAIKIWNQRAEERGKRRQKIKPEIRMYGWKIMPTPNHRKSAFCGMCGAYIGACDPEPGMICVRDRFCPMCGVEVDWEDIK